MRMSNLASRDLSEVEEVEALQLNMVAEEEMDFS